MRYILCVGDSLTFGARDEYQRGYPAELGRLYWERRRLPVYCVNAGLNGETSSQLRNRVVGLPALAPAARVALLLIGTNDTFLPQNPEIYRDNLRQIVQVLQAGGARVGVGLLPPALGPGLPNYPRDAQRQIDRFNEIIAALARELACFTADFRGLGPFVIDTVHLNHAGYRRMAELWFDALSAAGVEP
ncbi:MAG: SGNH/GDSL hydrolase family protein [Phycisphaerales bacterium]|nr:SGNH/GDSL hydrolase family protein [Phycisphaerales bacterium]